MRLYFARHGESEANTTGVFSNRPPGHALTAAGREQAQGLADRLRAEGIAQIYSSPLLRAQQTAEILAATVGAPVEVTDALREYDMGIYEGTKDPVGWEANRTLFMAWTIHKQWGQRVEGGESMDDMRRRFEPFVNGLVEAHRDSDLRVALVGHGGLYLALLPMLFENVRYRWALAHPFGNADVAVAEPGDRGLVCLSWCGLEPGVE
ncbi:MAG: histidine phosphatase family protein [Anaerolineae bacterium]|jgi:broad specificity phosphatase PhoE